MILPNLNLRTKFILYCSPLVICVFLLGAYSLWIFADIHNQLEKLQKDISPNAIAMLEVKKLLLSLESGVKEKSVDQQQVARYIEQLKSIVAAHPNHLTVKESSGASTTHDMVHHTIRTMGLSEYVLQQYESGWQDAELARIGDIIHQELVAVGPVLDEHLRIHLEELTKTETFVSQKYQQTLRFVVFAGLAVTIFTAIIVMAMVRTVFGPVKILEEGVKQIGEGNLDCRLDISTGDEFQFLAHEFSKMAAKLSEYHGSLEQKVQERTTELTQANDELQKAEKHVHLLSQELLKIQEAERQQISLDLHDNVAQELSSLKISGKLILADVQSGKVPDLQEVNEWGALLDRCIKIVRDLSYNLRPPGLEQLGLPSTISDYCRNFSKQTGIAVKFTKLGVENLQLDFNYAINLFRLLQESLNNIQKHATAGEVEVKLLYSHPNIILRIEDDGQGFDLKEGVRSARQNKRLGLLGMQERVRMMDGSIEISSNPQEGTKVLIEVPLGKDDDN